MNDGSYLQLIGIWGQTGKDLCDIALTLTIRCFTMSVSRRGVRQTTYRDTTPPSRSRIFWGIRDDIAKPIGRPTEKAPASGDPFAMGKCTICTLGFLNRHLCFPTESRGFTESSKLCRTSPLPWPDRVGYHEQTSKHYQLVSQPGTQAVHDGDQGTFDLEEVHRWDLYPRRPAYLRHLHREEGMAALCHRSGHRIERYKALQDS